MKISNCIVGDKILTNNDKVAIVAAEFNSLVVNQLLEGALDTLKRHGVLEENILIIRVPGAFELPLACLKVAKRGDIDGVIDGQTKHFDFVAGCSASGINEVALKTEKPVSLGVLTCETQEQALDRSGGKMGNKGAEAALACIEMISLMSKLSLVDEGRY
jgi:6,7-dimethyl-8-ribityllumazine synthase